MTITGVAQLKASLSAFLARVKAGEEVIVTERGRPIARLVPVKAEPDFERQRLADLERVGEIRLGSGILLQEFWELKARTSAVLREVAETGADIIVTVRGRPVARIEPVSASMGPPVDGMGGLRGALRDLPPLAWSDFVEAKQAWEVRPLGDE